MKKTESLKLITALSVGLSFLAMIFLSYWTSKMDGKYTGKKILHWPSRIHNEFLSASV